MDLGDTFKQIVERMADAPKLSEIRRGRIEGIAQSLRAVHPAILTFTVPPEEKIYAALEREFCDREVTVRSGDYGSPDRYLEDRKELRMPLRALLASMPTGDNLYMANQKASFELLQNLVGSFIDDLGGKQLFELPAVWLGGTGAITPLHKDSTDNFAFHFSGKKSWTVFSPLDASLLNLNKVNDRPGSEFAVSNLDLRSEDGIKRLRDAGATPITFDVNGGECLYLPAGWLSRAE